MIAVGGIIVGNSMTAATLAGRNFLRGARARSSEVEAWLSLGATPRQAHEEIGREAARESLLPTLDQTKSTGLVTLPGAFVGALFGGASPFVGGAVPAGGAGRDRAHDDPDRDRGDPAGRPDAVRPRPSAA